MPPEKNHVLPISGVAYVECDQGIYSTDEDVMFSPPYMRRRACGAVLVRDNMWIKDQEKFLGIKATRARGEVVAMLHLSDLKHRFETSGRVWMYADSFSPLIKAGWTVVATPHDVALDNVQALLEDDGEDGGDGESPGAINKGKMKADNDEEDDDEQSLELTKKGTEKVRQNEGPQESSKKRKGKPDHRRDEDEELPRKRRVV
ncbi:hypothetical protein B0H67DRAFT_647518 [Lasiosphaeris hirsuta]|uniref:Uncharacterized protein n=1 Tax=Lasiosphaeris hirsuta TaxID=260670 RepID=A0AA40A140_9PEZI|nr:hypothetical protein B0H67DRAFT_647518 [Lasiosphaeris hirsuta]